MSRTSVRGVAFGLALALATAAFSPALAEAGNGNRGRGNHGKGAKHKSSYSVKHQSHGGSYQTRGKTYRNYSTPRHHVVTHHDYVHHDHHGSEVGAFIGGLAVGAIIGTHVDHYAPPPPPPRRVWYYDCGPCGYHAPGYDRWVEHLVVVHHVPHCDVATYYPPRYRAHWVGW